MLDPLDWIEPKTEKDYSPGTIWGAIKLVVYIFGGLFVAINGLLDLIVEFICG